MSDKQFRTEAAAVFGTPIPSAREIRERNGGLDAALLNRLRDGGDLRRDRRMRLLDVAWLLPELRGEDHLDTRFVGARRYEMWVRAWAGTYSETAAIEALEASVGCELADDADEVMALAERIMTFVDGDQDA